MNKEFLKKSLNEAHIYVKTRADAISILWSMNYLALDYGEHRVGVAFADSEFRMAFSRETIDQKTTNLFVRLDELVKINKIDAYIFSLSNCCD